MLHGDGERRGSARPAPARPVAAVAPAVIVATTAPAATHAASRGSARPSSVATRTPSTDAGRSSSTATAPDPMSRPMSSIMRMFSETVAASDVAMYQVERDGASSRRRSAVVLRRRRARARASTATDDEVEPDATRRARRVRPAPRRAAVCSGHGEPAPRSWLRQLVDLGDDLLERRVDDRDVRRSDALSSSASRTARIDVERRCRRRASSSCRVCSRTVTPSRRERLGRLAQPDLDELGREQGAAHGRPPRRRRSPSRG